MAFLWCLQPGSLQHKIPVSKQISTINGKFPPWDSYIWQKKCGDFDIKVEFSGEVSTTNKSRSSYVLQVSGTAPVERDFIMEEHETIAKSSLHNFSGYHLRRWASGCWGGGGWGRGG